MLIPPSFFFILPLVAVTLTAGSSQIWLEMIPRKHWVSLAGGVSIAYVFVEFLPELVEAQEAFDHSAPAWVVFFERHVYVLALVGLITFYGLEKLAMGSRVKNRSSGGLDCTDPGVFWVHVSGYAVYNGLLGYLLQHSIEEWFLCLLLTIALGLHLAISSVSLREHHKGAYDQVGRWILAGALIIGWILGQVAALGVLALSVVIALVAGVLILTVLNEELPSERESSFWSFLGGATIFTLLLLSTAILKPDHHGGHGNPQGGEIHSTQESLGDHDNQSQEDHQKPLVDRTMNGDLINLD